MTSSTYILRGACPDAAGIVSKISTCLFDHGLNIEDAAQFNDKLSGHFFFRIECSGALPESFRTTFAQIAQTLQMEWSLTPADRRVKTLLLVSKSDHCLNDLLYRVRNDLLPVEITAVISNHEDNRHAVEREQLRYIYLPVDAHTRDDQEQKIAAIIEETGSELIVLARYMQVLSKDMSGKYAGRLINIHHSFLPGFKGAKPYHQAYNRGVKIIGATAHFVTSDLDEGPIIDQDVTRITHAQTPDKLQIIGQDIESRVLASAIQSYAERRIFLHDARTIIL
ncbi:MAG: formyltetrahydrofolate deformylase [Pseudobdellovibrionaceae bacterium]